ncbi:hypothetical protein ACFWVB_02720 [Streptomyces microflavus]|uniref:hypothetical protein n=1 Tax=Streptomyces microflavus TaxID=1919 RepID=UPI003647DC48
MGHVSDAQRATVADCACSASMTSGTAAWRLELYRVTSMARMRTVSGSLGLLRALGAGGTPHAEGLELQELTIRALATVTDDVLVITERGRAYLKALDEVHVATPVRVTDVNLRQRTALVEVTGWLPKEPVTVLLDQLTANTQRSADELTQLWLQADANVGAKSADDLVLTGFRSLVSLPAGWIPVGAGEEE